MIDIFNRVKISLANLNAELDKEIAGHFNNLIGDILRHSNKIQSKKNIIERNYQMLESAMEIVPLSILSCEEGLLESLLLANSNTLKLVKEPAEVQIDEGKLKMRMIILERGAEKIEEHFAAMDEEFKATFKQD